MKEKDLQTIFNRWCKYNMQESAAFELKLSKGKSLPFAAVVEHQKNALLAAKHGTVAFKIPDCGWQNPFDSFVLHHTPAYVVVAFHNQKREFVMIDIDEWIAEEERSDRKSITEERAKEIGTTHAIL